MITQSIKFDTVAIRVILACVSATSAYYSTYKHYISSKDQVQKVNIVYYHTQ